MGDVPANPVWDLFRGGLVGMIEVTICGQPFVYLKNMVQQGITPASNPLHWYRGFGVHASSMVPITALQMGANNMVQRALIGSSARTLSDTDKVIAALSAGAVTSTVAGPSELVMLYQQNSGTSFVNAARQVYQRFGVFGFGKGMGLVAARDGIFTLGYINAGPKVQQLVKEKTGSTAAGVAGSIGVGIAVGLVTHPFDTIKTEVMRPEKPKGYNFLQATGDLYRKGGFSTFFKGALPRTCRVVGSVIIYGNLNNYLDRFRPGPKPSEKELQKPAAAKPDAVAPPV